MTPFGSLPFLPAIFPPHNDRRPFGTIINLSEFYRFDDAENAAIQPEVISRMERLTV